MNNSWDDFYERCEQAKAVVAEPVNWTKAVGYRVAEPAKLNPPVIQRTKAADKSTWDAQKSTQYRENRNFWLVDHATDHGACQQRIMRVEERFPHIRRFRSWARCFRDAKPLACLDY